MPDPFKAYGGQAHDAPQQDPFAAYGGAAHQAQAAPPSRFDNFHATSIEAQPTGVGHWFQELEGDMRYGTGATLPGRIMQKLGRTSGVGESPAADFIGGPILGPTEVAQGVSQMGEHPVKGANVAIKGALKTVALPAAVMTAGAPTAAIKPLIGGTVGSAIASKITQAMTNDQDWQELAGNFGGLIGGLSGQALSKQSFANAIKRSGPLLTKIGDKLQGVNPDFLEFVSPRLAALQRLAKNDPLGVLPNRAAALARLAGVETESAPAAAQAAPQPQALAPTNQPQTNLPNATYLRDDIRSISQQPKIPKSKTPLLDSLKEWSQISKVRDEMNAQQGSPMEEQIMQWMNEHNQQAPGGRKWTAKSFEDALIKEASGAAGVPVPPDLPRTPANDEDLVDLLQKSIAKAQSARAEKP